MKTLLTTAKRSRVSIRLVEALWLAYRRRVRTQMSFDHWISHLKSWGGVWTVSVTDLWKKNIGGSPTGKRVEAPQALTCNINTGVRIAPPPGAQMDGDSGGQKNHWEGCTPAPCKSDPGLCRKLPPACQLVWSSCKVWLLYVMSCWSMLQACSRKMGKSRGRLLALYKVKIVNCARV